MTDEQGRQFGLVDDLKNPAHLAEFGGWLLAVAMLASIPLLGLACSL